MDSEVKTVYTVDFEILHRRLAHPSKDVMWQAQKGKVYGLPKFEIPVEHICPGCAQGKMPNKAFPPTETRAKEPFELIHSDLKSFPIDSYHKFKYSIVFYDDYTSHAWTINLRTKDAALPATKHFLAMVVRADLKSNHLVTKRCPLLPWNSGVAAGVLVGPN